MNSLWSHLTSHRMNRRELILGGAAVAAYAMLPRSAFGANPVQSNRLVYAGRWEGLVGVSGGIPNRTTQSGTTIPAYTGSASTINTAIANRPGRPGRSARNRNFQPKFIHQNCQKSRDSSRDCELEWCAHDHPEFHRRIWQLGSVRGERRMGRCRQQQVHQRHHYRWSRPWFHDGHSVDHANVTHSWPVYAHKRSAQCRRDRRRVVGPFRVAPLHTDGAS